MIHYSEKGNEMSFETSTISDWFVGKGIPWYLIPNEILSSSS